MDLNALKVKINETAFSPEVLQSLNEILDRAIASGSLSDEDRTTMADLIDVDADVDSLLADAHEEVMLALTNQADELTRVSQIAEVEEKAAESKMMQDMDKLDQEIEDLNAAGSDDAEPSGN